MFIFILFIVIFIFFIFIFILMCYLHLHVFLHLLHIHHHLHLRVHIHIMFFFCFLCFFFLFIFIIIKIILIHFLLHLLFHLLFIHHHLYVHLHVYLHRLIFGGFPWDKSVASVNEPWVCCWCFLGCWSLPRRTAAVKELFTAKAPAGRGWQGLQGGHWFRMLRGQMLWSEWVLTHLSKRWGRKQSSKNPNWKDSSDIYGILWTDHWIFAFAPRWE